MPTGPKPKPTALKLVQGNPGRRALNLNEPVHALAGPEIVPPARLSQAAAAKWHEVVLLLGRSGSLTVADLDMLANYCESFARSIDLKRLLVGTDYIAIGARGLVAHPWHGELMKEELFQLKIAAEFGLTPSSRSRIKVPESEPDNPFEDLGRR